MLPTYKVGVMAPHRTAAKHHRHGRHLHQKQDERLPRTVILMNQPGNESLAIAHHFRIKNGQNPHNQPGGRQAQRQKGLAAIQISGGRIQQTDPSPGRHGRRSPQGNAPERLGKDGKAFKRGTV